MNTTRDVWKGLIAIEGIDGSGKTTLLNSLGKTLTDKNIRLGSEPTNGSIGDVIRNAVSGRGALIPKTLAMLFAADRHEHIYGVGGIQEALNSGNIYITDRYLFSSLAYQTLFVDWDWVDQLNSKYPLPGHMIYLKLPVEDALDRISTRGRRAILETSELQRRAVESYRQSIDKYRDSGMKYLEIDSRKSPKEVCREGFDFISELF